MKLINEKTVSADGISYDFELNNCGFYNGLQCDIPTHRPKGREDYHIIFVIKGKVEAVIGNETVTAERGDIIFIPPFVPQKYTYFECNETDYGWIHFAGRLMPQILKIFPFKHSVYCTQNIEAFKIDLERIHTSALSSKRGDELLTNILLGNLIVSLGQELFAGNTENSREAKLYEIINRLNTFPEAEFENKKSAGECGVSEFHFIRIFKEKTGLTPVQYQISARLKKACLMLTDTDMTVGEIAFMCGFSDPLYFSRVFKKKMGQSPIGYRKSEY